MSVLHGGLSVPCRGWDKDAKGQTKRDPGTGQRNLTGPHEIVAAEMRVFFLQGPERATRNSISRRGGCSFYTHKKKGGDVASEPKKEAAEP